MNPKLPKLIYFTCMASILIFAGLVVAAFYGYIRVEAPFYITPSVILLFMVYMAVKVYLHEKKRRKYLDFLKQYPLTPDEAFSQDDIQIKKDDGVSNRDGSHLDFFEIDKVRCCANHNAEMELRILDGREPLKNWVEGESMIGYTEVIHEDEYFKTFTSIGDDGVKYTYKYKKFAHEKDLEYQKKLKEGAFIKDVGLFMPIS